jgi:hypothetical protein
MISDGEFQAQNIEQTMRYDRKVKIVPVPGNQEK